MLIILTATFLCWFKRVQGEEYMFTMLFGLLELIVESAIYMDTMR